MELSLPPCSVLTGDKLRMIAPLGAVPTLLPPPPPQTGLGRAGVRETGREAYAAADPWIGLGRCFVTQSGQAWTPNPRTGCSSDLSFMER